MIILTNIWLKLLLNTRTLISRYQETTFTKQTYRELSRLLSFSWSKHKWYVFTSKSHPSAILPLYLSRHVTTWHDRTSDTQNTNLPCHKCKTQLCDPQKELDFQFTKGMFEECIGLNLQTLINDQVWSFLFYEICLWVSLTWLRFWDFFCKNLLKYS